MKKLILIGLLMLPMQAHAKSEIETIKEDLAVLQRQMYQNQSATPQSLTGEFEENFRDLVGRVDKFEHSLKKLEEKIDLINKDIGVRISLLEGSPIAQTPATPEKPKEKFVAKVANKAPKSITGDSVGSDELQSLQSKDPKVIYQQGMDAINAKKYDLAEQKFAYFLQNFKEDKLLGNAQYWLGEVYYVNKDYKKAAIAFAKGYQIKGSNKGADSLLKLGLSMVSLKKNDEACAAFSSMPKEFPKAEKTILDKAAAEAKKLECK